MTATQFEMMTNAELRSDWDYGRQDERSEKALEELRKRDQVGPDGRPHVWGTVTQQHVIGEYTIIESQPDSSLWRGGRQVSAAERIDEIAFYPYVGERSIGHSFGTLDKALVHAVAYKHLLANCGSGSASNDSSRASTFFMRMVGAEQVEKRDS